MSGSLPNYLDITFGTSVKVWCYVEIKRSAEGYAILQPTCMTNTT